ncbi:MAG: transposase [Bacteroidales bacterium]|nr:transposase [Bacteroidales bacterium]
MLNQKKVEIFLVKFRKSLAKQFLEIAIYKTKVRSRVEHGFGFIKGAMHGFNVRCIGIKRTTEAIFMTCFTYNLFRFEQIARLGIKFIWNF